MHAHRTPARPLVHTRACPPGHVAALFRKVITDKYAGVLQCITFAIVDDENAGLQHNRDGNWKEFQESFQNPIIKVDKAGCVVA